MNRREEAIAVRFQNEIAAGSTMIVPAPVLFKLRYGTAKSQHPAQNHERIDAFLIAIIEFDGAEKREAGEIGTFLENQGTPIGPYEL